MRTQIVNKTNKYIAAHKAFAKKLKEIFNQKIKPGHGQMAQIAKRLGGKNKRQVVSNWLTGKHSPSLETLHHIIKIFDVNESDKELLIKLRETKTLGARRHPLHIVRTTKKNHAILLESLKESIVGLESGHLDVDDTLIKLKLTSSRILEENLII